MSQKKVSAQELKIQIRWLIRRDMHDVLTIERVSSIILGPKKTFSAASASETASAWSPSMNTASSAS